MLANLFLHYALDLWLTREHPGNPFERYADDAIVHCRSREEAEKLCAAIGARLAECGLTLNANKTKVWKREPDLPRHIPTLQTS